MGLLDAISSRVMPAEARAAVLEMRAADAAGRLAEGRVSRPTWGKRSPQDYDAEGYAKLALVHRCISMTANNFAKAILRTIEERPDGEIVNRPDHRMDALLRRPNPDMRQNRFLATIAMMSAVTGFCVIEKERNQRGDVIALWPLESYRLSAIRRNQAPADWEFTIPGSSEKIRLEAANVIAFTYADRPDLAPYGIGPTEVAFREIGLSNVMTDFLKAFFDRGAQPQYALVLDKNIRANQAKADDIKARWRRRAGGLMKSVDPVILEGVQDLKHLGFDMNELALQSLRDLSETSICQAFGISPLLVDTLAGISKSTFSNKEDARKGFYEETISSLWDRLDDVFTLGLLSEFEPPNSRISLQFDTSKIPALQDNIDERAGWVVNAFNAALFSNHMALRRLGEPIPKGLPEYFNRSIAVESFAFGDKALLAIDEPAPAPAARAALTNGDASRAIAVAELVAPYRHLRDQRDAGAGPAEIRANVGKIHRKTITRIAHKAKPWYATFFRAQAVRLLSAASRAGGIDFETRSIAEIDWNDEAAELNKVMTRHYALSADSAYASAADILDVAIDFDLANPELANVRDLLAQEVVDVTDETRRVISDVVTKGLQDGIGIDGITDQLQATFDGWPGFRAERIARTESMKSFGYANASAFRASGIVDRIQVFDNATHVDDYGAADGLTCATRDGLIDTLDSAELHIDSEHPNGSEVVTPVTIGEE